MVQINGRFLWHELMTTDVASAKKFYGTVVGWTAETDKDAVPGYEIWKMGDRMTGGLMTLPEEARAMDVPPHWMLYIGSDDPKATIAQALDAGAETIRPLEKLPDGLSFALLRDPQGGYFSVMHSEMHSTYEEDPDAPAEIGDFSWHELGTSDYEAAWKFYHDLFGWKLGEDVDMKPGIYRTFMASTHTGGGMYTVSPEMGPPAWMGYIRVKNLDESLQHCKDLGGKILNGPMEVPGGDRVGNCIDPQGAMFSLHELTR